MDVNKEFDEFLSSMKKFNINVASEFLSNISYDTKYAGDIIELLGKGLTNEYFKSRPEYFNFCEEQLLKLANNEEYQELVFDFLDIIEMDDCKLSSSVLIVVTVLENTENPNLASLEYLLLGTFNCLFEMDATNLKDILLTIIQLLIRLRKHFLLQQSILYYFARVAFLVLNTNIEPIEYLNLLSSIIYDPFYLLEYEFDELEEKKEVLYIASFFYLYFKTGMQWGPKIYNRFYVLDKCCNLAMSVYEDNILGKSFAKLILTKFKNNEIPLHSLNKRHEHFLLEAAHSSVFNEHLNVRKESIESLMLFIDKLCTDAQYVVFKYVFSKPLESCIKEQFIVKMKNLIFSHLKLEHDLGCFQGIRLLNIIKLCCNISVKRGFYLQKNKEHILSAISLYLSLVHNIEILNMGEEFLNLTKQFVDTIQNVIDYSHKEQKIELKNLGNDDCRVKDKEIIIENNFNSNPNPKLSNKEKRDLLSQMNTTITLVQSNLDMLKRFIKNKEPVCKTFKLAST